MSRANEIERIEFEELAALFLERGLDEPSHRRFDSLLDAHPDWEEEWQKIFQTTLQVRGASLSMERDFPIQAKGIQEKHRFIPIGHHSFRTAALSAAALMILIPVFYFSFFWPHSSGMTPKSRVVSVNGLCYDTNGHIPVGGSVPPQTAAGPGSACHFEFQFEKLVQVDLEGPARMSVSLTPSVLRLGLEQGSVLIESKQSKPNERGGFLYVETAGVIMEARGTRFHVTRSDDGTVLLEVTEGIVFLQPGKNAEDLSRKDGTQKGLSISAGEAWSGQVRDSELVGVQSPIRDSQNNANKQKRLESSPPLLQTLVTRSGRAYTGTISQTDSGYQVLTASGSVFVPLDQVERIDIRLSQEGPSSPEERERQ